MEAVDHDGSNHSKRSLSSSSSSSSGGYCFQLDDSDLNKQVPSPNTPRNPSQLWDAKGLVSLADAPESEKNVQHGLPPKYGGGSPSGEYVRLSGMTQSDLPVAANSLSSDSGGGVTQSPPPQVMGKWDIPDPNRIPSSIFARTKSTAPMEWSAASNESLFSIHAGNNSFSRDHLLLGLSGELTFPNSMEPFPPPPTAGDSDRRNLKGEGLGDPHVTKAANAAAMNDVLRAAAEEQVSQKVAPLGEASQSRSISHNSDASVTSSRSFAFPILTEEGGKSGSVKVVETDQLQQHEHNQENSNKSEVVPQVGPDPAESKWLPCFSCC